MRRLVGVAACALLAAIAGCGKTQVEEAQEIVTESPQEKAEREGLVVVDSTPKRDEKWVVAEVIGVSIDFSTVDLKIPEGADVATGDVFTVYKDYKPLPASRNLHTHFNQLYLGKVQVTHVGQRAASAKVLHRATVTPIKAGDSAVAKSY